jgi:3-hydroxyisobutyrate dehydrogenase-like beta-hydroxyacid dehydrogenase
MTRHSAQRAAKEGSMSDPVGIVGLGLMGSVLARRLIAAGFDVVGYDIDVAKTDGLVAFGGRAAVSIDDVARAANPIILAVFDTDQVEQVVEGPILAALGDGSGRIVMCTSTCDPDRIATLARRVEDRGLRFLETPVSGTSEQVRRGEGVGLIGGDAEVTAQVAGVLDAIFPVRFHVGGPGDGGRAKLAVNLILGLNRVALAEGLVFASRLGLNPQAFLKIARGSAAYSQVMDTKGAKMATSNFTPEGRARQTLKDVHLTLDQAARCGQALPLLEVHRDILTACVAAGEGDLDNSVVINEIRRRR